jgi:hypothetical protein
MANVVAVCAGSWYTALPNPTPATAISGTISAGSLATSGTPCFSAVGALPKYSVIPAAPS